MVLDKLSYSEYLQSPNQWILDEFKLNDINLIVGNNASGKTRTLNVISGLSKILLSPKLAFQNGHYKASFVLKDKNYDYEVEFLNNVVLNESLKVDLKHFIIRNQNGEGEIFSELTKTNTKFKIPNNELIACRRDELQYPYLENLYTWATKLRHFRFAKEQEKQTLAIVDVNKPKPETFNLKETDKAIAFFRYGIKEFSTKFQREIIKDFNNIGYSISDIDLKPMQSIKIESPVENVIVGLTIQETDRNGQTDQNAMSDGMFRALSIIIHFNYYKLAQLSGTVLIDDVGEGLDFERSTKLIKLLIKKAQNSNIQLIMSTNDKFVMNNTKLDFWQVIHRDGSQVRMYNITNSQKVFDDFRFTGLNNFDFFTTDFFKTGLQ
jgi:AAA15 family ATPase/GTPase